MSLGLLGFGIFINYKSSFYIKMLEESSDINIEYKDNINSIKKEFKIINMQQELYNEVESNNLILKKSVKNLFDLVPDQITLTDVVMKREELILKGYSTTKESYTLLLEPPLRSIFDKSQVAFTKDDRGYYRFISKNIIEKGKDLNNDRK
jgi:hypothetical protein